MYKCNECGNRDEFNETREYAIIHYRRSVDTKDLEIFEVEYGDVTEVICLKCGSDDVGIEF